MSEMERKNIVVWGDSLAEGVVWDAARGRYARVSPTAVQVAGETLGISIENHAHFGYTAPKGRTLLSRDLEKGFLCDTAVIEFGGNDCNFDWAAIADDPNGTHLPATTPAAFEETLKEMVDDLRAAGVKPILTTLPPINAERYFRFLSGDRLNAANILKWLGDVQQIYRFQEMYSLLVEKVARLCSVALLDLRRRCLAERTFTNSMLCADGLHLTPEGQRFVGREIASLL